MYVVFYKVELVCPQDDVECTEDSVDPLARRDGPAEGGPKAKRLLKPTLRPSFRPRKIYVPVRRPAESSPMMRVTLFLVPMANEGPHGFVYESPRRRPGVSADAAVEGS